MIERRREPEWMDEPGLDPALHRQALIGLERINVLSRTVASVWDPVRSAFQRQPTRPFTILDVACGAGDLAVGLAARARRSGLPASVHGCDISATAIAHARERAAEQGVNASFFQLDVFADRLAQPYDVVTCSLFLHHLDDDAAVRLLRILQQSARSLVVVSDLNRTALGAALAWLGPRLLTRSPVVHVDSLRSVRAASTTAEAHALCTRAGLTPYTITTVWPCRWRMVAEIGR